MNDELIEIKNRYDRRGSYGNKYDILNPSVYLNLQERERALIKWLKNYVVKEPSELKLLEIGCGYGSNILQFVKLGFQPENLIGNELIKERVEHAKKILPTSVRLYEGDASNINLPNESFDIVFQSMVFSSILDYEFKGKLANKMWQLTKPGGGILWYDFIYDNPINKDVKGIKFKEVKLLFPYGIIKKWKLTLAPPVSRLVTKVHPSLYFIFNFFPFLRTHILCWIEKKY